MNIKSIIWGMIVILTIVSCENIIDVDQPDIIEQEQAFSDKNSTRLSINGIYGLMSELVEPMFLAGEIRADLAIANKSADAYIKEFSNNSFSASNPYITPKKFYTIINNTNDFINQFQGFLEDEKMDSTDFYKYTSELVAIRVWSQYQVAKLFGFCKYYNEHYGQNDSVEIMNYAYEDTSFLRVLIQDLTYSDTINFTTTTDNVEWQTARISDFYVNALMGELYMDIGEYDSAIEKFNEVLLFGDLSNRVAGRFKTNKAFTDGGEYWYIEFFEANWESSKLPENAVFLLAFDNKYNQTNELWNWTLSLNKQVVPTQWFSTQFVQQATADELKIDYRVLSIVDQGSESQQYSISKYLEDDKPFIITRAARISLLKALCYNATGQGNKALTELKNIRNRVKFTLIDNNEMPEDENEAKIWLENIILDELAYETCYEGQRWFDIMRIANMRNDPSFLANKVAEKYPEETREQIKSKLNDKANWYLPIYE